MTSTLVRTLQRAASQARYHLFPTPEIAAWRRACRVAVQTPRHTPGEIGLNGFHLAYADLLTLCPQWHDIFVTESLRFEAPTLEPRILDCGANIGLASLYFKRLYPRSRVTAFEPDAALAALCRRNLVANHAGDVEVQGVAVWTESGGVRFHREGADSGAIEGTSAGVTGPLVVVPSVRLRDVLARERVDLLKLDIEGAEAEVLADCADALDRVAAIVMDLHEFDPLRRRTPDIMRLLAGAGFTVALSELVPLPWRAPRGLSLPFPGRAPAWAMTLYAWRA